MYFVLGAFILVIVLLNAADDYIKLRTISNMLTSVYGYENITPVDITIDDINKNNNLPQTMDKPIIA